MTHCEADLLQPEEDKENNSVLVGGMSESSA